MSGLVYTLIADGTSDRTLMPAIEWVLRCLGLRIELGRFAEPSSLPRHARTLDERVHEALRLFPCHVLFVHRDAEREPFESRRSEIAAALEHGTQRWVPVIPVRMTEAWLLHDEAAIRRASGNPNGTLPLDLPQPTNVESVTDPKQVLFDALLDATELSGGRRKKARKKLHPMRHRVAQLIEDYAPLQHASSFAQLIDDVRRVCAELEIG